MKTIFSCLGLSFVLALPAGAETLDPDDWYQNHYAPIWKVNPANMLERGLAFYNETLYLHPPEGGITTVSSRTWLAENLEAWVSEGWLGSVVTEYRSDRLNPTTVAFKAKWRDSFVDGSEEFTCGWYVADLRDSRWLFTQYAEIECAEHEL